MNTSPPAANAPYHEIQPRQRLANTTPVFSLPPHISSSSSSSSSRGGGRRGESYHLTTTTTTTTTTSSRRLTTTIVLVVLLLLGSTMGMLVYINYATISSLFIDHKKIVVPNSVAEDQHKQRQQQQQQPPRSAHHPLKKNNKEDDGGDTDTVNALDTNPIFNKQYDNCIVGAGLSGSVIAENYATVLSQTSLIIERRHHIGGNCFDYIDTETGIRVSLFGAHLFHTKHTRVWEYVQRFGEWVPYEHRVLGLVNGKHVPIPVTIDTVNTLFDLNITNSQQMDEWLKNEQVLLVDEDGKNRPREPINSEEVALARVGPRLYDLIFKPYTYKQWAKYPAELGPEVLSRIPFRNNFDGRYFSDKYQALPKNGYTSLFEKMLDSPLITVVKNTDFFDVKDRLKCKRLYYTGPIDTYFAELQWPKLEYRSLSFERVVQHDTPGYYQQAPVVNYPQAHDVDGNPIDYTRIVEYKHLLNQTSNHTIYFIERSKDGGEPYYPVPNNENKELYKKYQEMAEKEEGVTFVGRLANYKYFNMDDAILNALELFDRDTKGIQ